MSFKRCRSAWSSSSVRGLPSLQDQPCHCSIFALDHVADLVALLVDDMHAIAQIGVLMVKRHDLVCRRHRPPRSAAGPPRIDERRLRFRCGDVLPAHRWRQAIVQAMDEIAKAPAASQRHAWRSLRMFLPAQRRSLNSAISVHIQSCQPAFLALGQHHSANLMRHYVRRIESSKVFRFASRHELGYSSGKCIRI